MAFFSLNHPRSSLFFFFLFFAIAASAPHISDNIFESQEFIGRNLLQAKSGCNVNFEFLNYTIITSQCKGPQYLPKLCCPAFKQFACPYADQINDLTSECASTMFSYINLYGKYPPGLFSSQCREGKEGLDCTGFEHVTGSDINSSTGFIARTLSPIVVAAASLALLHQIF